MLTGKSQNPDGVDRTFEGIELSFSLAQQRYQIDRSALEFFNRHETVEKVFVSVRQRRQLCCTKRILSQNKNVIPHRQFSSRWAGWRITAAGLPSL